MENNTFHDQAVFIDCGSAVSKLICPTTNGITSSFLKASASFHPDDLKRTHLNQFELAEGLRLATGEGCVHPIKTASPLYDTSFAQRAMIYHHLINANLANKRQNIHLVINLEAYFLPAGPVDNDNIKRYKQYLSLPIKRVGESSSLCIQKINIYPSCLPALFDYTTDESGNLLAPFKNDTKVLVIDCGHTLTQCCVSSLAGQVFHTKTIHNQVTRLKSNENKYLRSRAQQLLLDIKKMHMDFPDLEAIFLIGGNSTGIKRILKRYSQLPIIKSSSPLFANLNGVLKLDKYKRTML